MGEFFTLLSFLAYMSSPFLFFLILFNLCIRLGREEANMK
jgi:hypothetical protein